MKYKVAELEGALLDAAVAKCEGAEPRKVLVSLTFADDSPAKFQMMHKRYSSNWQYGGPIIERERMAIEPGDSSGRSGWIAQHFGSATEFGSTFLIAAMRAYVASKFGNEVEL
jgi:hypothetical protein